MVYILSGLLNWLRSLFFAKHLEVTIVGLQVRPSQLIKADKKMKMLTMIGQW
jgi:hypothetical protein